MTAFHRPLTVWFALGLVLFARSELAAAANWASPATGGDVSLIVHEPRANASCPAPVIFYLRNLAATRVGTEPDEAIVGDLCAEGFFVVVLDYRSHERARWPYLNQDFVALRSALQKKRLFADRSIDLAHVFIVPAGCRLKRDVVFYRDRSRTLAMDVIYPSRPAHPVGALLEFSCDNQDRMSNFSLDFCTDTLLAGAATEGFAVAMADHPVAAPYKGLDPMPDSAWKAEAAVRTLRAQAPSLGLNGRIVAAGFSRGSGMALLLAATGGRSEFDGRGEHARSDSSIQGAVVLSGRFTYLDLLPNDPMIPRYTAAWGERAAHEDVWRAQGALDFLTAPTVPLFLSINCTESPEALHQMEVLRRRLGELNSPFEYHPDLEPRGHRVPLTPSVLNPLLAYVRRQLSETSSP